MTSARCLLHVPTYLSRCVMVYTCVYRPTCAHWPSLLRSLSFCHYFAIAPVTFRGRYRIISLLFSLSYTHFSSNSFTVAWLLGLLAKQMAKPLGPVEPPTGPRRNQNNFQSDQHFGLYCKNKREHVGSHDRNLRTRARQCLTTACAVILQCTVKARALTGSSPDRTAMLANDVMVFVTSARTDSVVSSREHCV